MNNEIVEDLKDTLKKVKNQIRIMEVCGTHTMSIGKLGLRNLLGEKVQLISGPGCPVCVTHSMYIDYVYALAVYKNITIITYGDMLRVPGTSPEITLENARALGAEVKIVYSAMDAIKISKEVKEREYLFLGIGFETTIPSTCILIEEIISHKIENLYILSLHKKVEPVITKLLDDKDIDIDGFLCPGNVAVIIGEEGLEFLEREGKAGVISGFSEDEIISSISMLIKIILNKSKLLINNYKKCVRDSGNIIALNLIEKFLELDTSIWRGIGKIPYSGYVLKEKYNFLNIENKYKVSEIIRLVQGNKLHYGCRCGEVLKGKLKPIECELFSNVCTPTFPIGPCMVSSEGTCSAYYKYERR